MQKSKKTKQRNRQTSYQQQEASAPSHDLPLRSWLKLLLGTKPTICFFASNHKSYPNFCFWHVLDNFSDEEVILGQEN